MTSFDYVVTEQDKHERLDLLLARLEPDHSRSQVQKWIRSKRVTINGKTAKANDKCAVADVIHWSIPVDKPLSIHPENILLDIIYEDEDLLVVNKPKGMVVHPSANHQSGTLVHALLNHCQQLSTIGGAERPGIVHRIDRDTAGLLVVAKTDTIHLELVKQFKERKVERIYEAIVDGVIEHESGLIDAPIGRDPSHRLRMSVVDDGKPAKTHFQVKQRYEKHTHVICRLETGRTHQIRVHMDYIGYPLVGDPKYAKTNRLSMDGQALFAKKLGFIHPGNQEWVAFEAELPLYFQDLLIKL